MYLFSEINTFGDINGTTTLVQANVALPCPFHILNFSILTRIHTADVVQCHYFLLATKRGKYNSWSCPRGTVCSSNGVSVSSSALI